MNAKVIGVAALAGLMLAGCGKKEEEQKADELAISVNGVRLMQSAIDADVEKIIAAQGDRIPAEQLDYARKSIGNQMVQAFIYKTILIAKAKELGYVVTDADRKEQEEKMFKDMAKMPDAPKTLEEVFAKFPLGEDRAREEFESGILVDKMVKGEQAKAPAKDYTADAQKIIDNIVSNNVKAKASSVEALTKIKALKAQLDKVPAANLTNEFAKLAKENSACPSSAKGGDLGEFQHGQMVKEFDEVAFKLPVGKVSEPVKTQFGYHLVMTTKKIPAVKDEAGKETSPEKVQASHILVKIDQEREVPKMDEVVKRLKMQGDRSFMIEFMEKEMKKAKFEASEEYKQFLPAKEESAEAESPAEKPIEKPAEK